MLERILVWELHLALNAHPLLGEAGTVNMRITSAPHAARGTGGSPASRTQDNARITATRSLASRALATQTMAHARVTTGGGVQIVVKI